MGGFEEGRPGKSRIDGFEDCGKPNRSSRLNSRLTALSFKYLQTLPDLMFGRFGPKDQTAAVLLSTTATMVV
jgi:hypothetical protein